MQATKIRWIEDLQEGLDRARATGRPAMLDFFKPT
jgi:hypothetical protein